MAKFLLTNKAVEDLTNIWNYTLFTWSEQQADKYYEMLINVCQEIAIKPELGRKYNTILPSLLGFRAQRHIIFYRHKNSNEIEIIRILHESMDLKNRILQ